MDAGSSSGTSGSTGTVPRCTADMVAENGGGYSGWNDTPGDGRARVWVGSSSRSLDGKTFSNLDGRVNTTKLSEVLGS